MTKSDLHVLSLAHTTCAEIQKRPSRSWVVLEEGEGFEPSVALTPQLFSRQSHSAALAPFREEKFIGVTNA